MQQEKLARARADKRVVEVSVLDTYSHFYGEDKFFLLDLSNPCIQVSSVFYGLKFFCCLLPSW